MTIRLINKLLLILYNINYIKSILNKLKNMTKGYEIKKRLEGNTEIVEVIKKPEEKTRDNKLNNKKKI